MSDDFFAPPPFRPDDAMVNLRRSVRDWRMLHERGNTWEMQGVVVLRLAVQDGAIHASLAKRLARTPEWENHTLRSSLDVRKFTEELKRRVNRWGDRDE